ncbi:MAG: DUF1858 domain-containing protein [Candidatus Moranbacteria bacterium]|nr:DUF1858 domain-containing protein [Candidatus Moranbacteria bacterium]
MNLNTSIYELITKFPELKEVLFDIGFVDIIKPGMLQTVGRFMTLKKGSEAKRMDLSIIQEKLIQKGYTIKE